MHILVVGSSVIDLFISIDKDHVELRDRKALLNLGDKIPSEIKKLALGGNGANISVGLTRLEIPTSFYTYLGNDILSREIEEGLSKEGVELIAQRGSIQAAPVHIILDFDGDRIILSHYETSNHDFVYGGSDKFNYIYLNSIADSWENAYQKVLDFALKNNIPFAFSPGTRQLDNLNDLIYKVMKNTKIYFSNLEEALKITKSQSSAASKEDVKNLLLEVKKLGPEVVSITDGAKGAYAIDKDNNCFFVEAVPTEGKERTGAGDSYATGFFASYLCGNDISKCIMWGSANAKGVMENLGAQSGLLNKKGLDEMVTKINNLEVHKI
jgi:sugar/nucleoside kinase (ribokinase family)